MCVSLCLSYYTVEEIPIIDRWAGEEVNRGQLCPFVSAWVMSGKVSQRQPREIGSSDVTSRVADTRWKRQLRSRSPTAAGTGGVCPQAPGCVSSCPPKFPPSQVPLAVRQLSGNPLIQTAILGNVCPGHESCTSNIPAIYLLVLAPCYNLSVALLSPSGQGAHPPRLGLWQSSLNSQLCVLRLPGWS